MSDKSLLQNESISSDGHHESSTSSDRMNRPSHSHSYSHHHHSHRQDDADRYRKKKMSSMKRRHLIGKALFIAGIIVVFVLFVMIVWAIFNDTPVYYKVFKPKYDF